MEPLLIALFVVVAGAIGVYGYKKEKQRKLEIQGFASHMGLSYAPARTGSVEQRYGIFRILREGSNRYAQNVMEGGHEGRRCCAFDYHYETYTTDSKGRRQTHHHHFSAVVLECGLPLKPLFLRPESVLDRMGEMFGLDDIDFESTDFSRAFHVKAPDRRWAFDVLHQATMEFLLGAPRYHVEMQGPWAMAWRTSRMKAVDFQGALHVLDGILDRLPRYLVQDLTGGPKA